MTVITSHHILRILSKASVQERIGRTGSILLQMTWRTNAYPMKERKVFRLGRNSDRLTGLHRAFGFSISRRLIRKCSYKEGGKLVSERPSYFVSLPFETLGPINRGYRPTSSELAVSCLSCQTTTGKRRTYWSWYQWQFNAVAFHRSFPAFQPNSA